jgi:anti-sigma factor RsiW
MTGAGRGYGRGCRNLESHPASNLMRRVVDTIQTDAARLRPALNLEINAVTCREFADFIMGYLSAELPEETRTRFMRHLSLCVNCQAYLKSYEETVKLGKRAFEDENSAIPGEVPEDLVNAILDARRSS